MLEKLKTRRAALEIQQATAQQRVQKALADVTAIGGAIQEIDFWIIKIETEESDGCKDETSAGN